jgi:hypothetical protein
MSGHEQVSPNEVMTRLARQFPVLKGAPGVEPWEPEVLDEWAMSGASGAGARAVTRFLLAVWNGSEYVWKVGGFRLRDLGDLDDEHLEIWKAWAARPFFL